MPCSASGNISTMTVIAFVRVDGMVMVSAWPRTLIVTMTKRNSCAIGAIGRSVRVVVSDTRTC